MFRICVGCISKSFGSVHDRRLSRAEGAGERGGRLCAMVRSFVSLCDWQFGVKRGRGI